MNKLNFKSLVLAILLGMGVGTFLHAQQEAPQKETSTKIIIIKKTIDEDGNEVVEKIIKEGEEAEGFYFETTDGAQEVDVRVIKEGDNDIHIISHDKILELEGLEKLESLEGLEGLEDIEINIEKDLKGIDMDQLNDFEHQFKFRFETDGEAPQILEWNGTGEMPAEIQEKLEKMKLKLADHQEGSPEWNFMRGIGHKNYHQDNGAFLGVVLNEKVEVTVENGVETREGSSEKGAHVSDVRAESAAQKAGLKSGDIITDIDGEPVNSFSDLTDIISKHQPKDEISIAFLRDGKVQTTTAVLGKRERKSTGFSVWHDNDDYTITRDLPCLLIGVYTETVKSIPGSQGVRVTSIIEDTPAEAIKMQAGDVIIALDGAIIDTHDELTVERDKHAPGDKVSIVYLRDGQEIADEITFRECDPQTEKTYTIRRGPNSKRDVKKKKRIIIIKKKKGEEESVEEIPGEETAAPRLAPKENKSLELTAFRAFPNPTDGIVTLRFEGEALPTVLKVTDVSGREIYREELEDFPGWYSNRVDLSDAAPGTLLLSIEQDGKVFTEKLVMSEGNRP